MKKNIKNDLRYGTATALLFAAGLMGATSVSAQDQTEKEVPVEEVEEREVEVVSVTGSRIRRSTETLLEPVFIANRELFDNRQFTNVVEALNENLLFIGNGGAGGGPGQNGAAFAFLNILGLGSQRTLTLIDGRRFPVTNFNTVFVPDNSTGSQVDVSAIPTALVDSVETLIGTTAGSVYGADAVAGVSNIKLRDDFEGINILGRFGITDQGDNEEYNISAAYGENFDDDRGNVALSFEYLNSESFEGRERSFLSAGRGNITNPINGNIRNPAPFNPGSAAAILAGGGSLPMAFLPAGGDGIPSNVAVAGLVNPTSSLGGTIAGGTGGFSGISQFIDNGLVPGSLAGSAADPAGFAFFAPSSLPAGVDPGAVIGSLAPGTSTTGLTPAQLGSLALGLLQRNRPTPAEFFASNPAIDPLLFYGTFADTDIFPRIPNTDPATSALFPFIATPLRFNNSGNLVPVVLGETDPRFTDVNSIIGGDGLAFNGAGNQLVPDVERFSAFVKSSYEINDNVTIYGDALYSRVAFDQFQNAPTVGGFNGTSGQGSLRIFIDDNPFVTDQALQTLNGLEAQGLGIATQDGSRFISIRRNLNDIFGGLQNSTSVTQTFRGTAGVKGDFEYASREFYYDAAFVYGRSESVANNEQRLDIEFFLAADAVEDENGNIVCRQQTLDAPESIAARNPGLGGVFNLNGLVPTQAQIDACIPLNLLGQGGVTQANVDQIVASNELVNTTELVYFAASLGGELFELPAGWAAFSVQGEFRRESNALEVDDIANLGLGQNANTLGADGINEFTEFGAEINIPIFGGDFTLPGIQSLEASGAFRRVSRSSDTSNPLFAPILPSLGTVTDDVFSVKLGWRPFNDILIRASFGQAVRSPSQTQLFGALQFAFSNGNGSFPCTASSVNQGPNPTVRAANCAAAFAALGLPDPENFAANFQNIGATETTGVVGNPFLSNEQSESYNLGFVYTPSWLPGFSLQADYFAIELTNQIGLEGPGTTIPTCFDSPDFPNVDLNGTNACSQFIFGEEGPDGVFIVPADAINQLNGDPVLVGPQAGQPINGQGPAQIAFSFFSNLNLASTEVRQFNIRAGYRFNVDDIFGFDKDLGRINITTQIVIPERVVSFPDGTPATANPAIGDGISSFSSISRLDYSVGDFGFLFTHIFAKSTIGNIQTPPEDIPEQSIFFQGRDSHVYFLDLRYRITDDLTARISIENLFGDNGFNLNGANNDPQFVTSSRGRFIRFGINARF